MSNRVAAKDLLPGMVVVQDHETVTIMGVPAIAPTRKGETGFARNVLVSTDHGFRSFAAGHPLRLA